ncbi:MAG: sulfotransferase family protein [Micromonosporaceae bacterium]|nr:sulfotransferase family protein [Micromonosporaceae bacterium]
MSTPIALWAAPRSRSTAFMRVMMERGDLQVVHEPFSGLLAEGSFDVLGESAGSMPELLGALLRRSTDDARVFFKETSDYRYDGLLADERLYQRVVNTFMIRDPRAAVASHYALYPNVTLDEVGFEYLHTIFQAVREATGEIPAVIDGDDLVADPEGVLRAYCERVGLPFRPESLRWQPGAQRVWERTEKWHRDVALSSGLTDRGRRHRVRPDNDPRLGELARHHQPFYEAMRAHRLTPREPAGPDGRAVTPGG